MCVCVCVQYGHTFTAEEGGKTKLDETAHHCPWVTSTLTQRNIIIQYGPAPSALQCASNSYFNNQQFGVSCVNTFYYKVRQLLRFFFIVPWLVIAIKPQHAEWVEDNGRCRKWFPVTGKNKVWLVGVRGRTFVITVASTDLHLRLLMQGNILQAPGPLCS